MEKLLSIYKNKIITNVKQYNIDEYYYFYDHNNEIFGISKDITNNEYALLKMTYREKKIYNKKVKNQNVYDYIYENDVFPFSNTKIRFFIYKAKESIVKVINEMLNEIFENIIILEHNGLQVCFYDKNFDISLEDLFASLSADFSEDIYVHSGPYIRNNVKGKDVLIYIDSYSLINNKYKYNTSVADLLFESSLPNFVELVKIIRNLVLKPIESKTEYMDLMKQLFKNDLNVSKTSKDMYINRNSILAKLEYIQKETGINIQKFTGACAFKILLSI